MNNQTLQPSKVMTNADKPNTSSIANLKIEQEEPKVSPISFSVQDEDGSMVSDIESQAQQESIEKQSPYTIFDKEFYSQSPSRSEIRQREFDKDTLDKIQNGKIGDVKFIKNGFGSRINADLLDEITAPVALKAMGATDEQLKDGMFIAKAIGQMADSMSQIGDDGATIPYARPFTQREIARTTRDYLANQKMKEKAYANAVEFAYASANLPQAEKLKLLSDIQKKDGDASKYAWYNEVYQQAMSDAKYNLDELENNPKYERVKKVRDKFSNLLKEDTTIYNVSDYYELGASILEASDWNEDQALMMISLVLGGLTTANQIKDGSKWNIVGNVQRGVESTFQEMATSIADSLSLGFGKSVNTLTGKNIYDTEKDEKIFAFASRLRAMKNQSELAYDSMLANISSGVGGTIAYGLSFAVGGLGKTALTSKVAQGTSVVSNASKVAYGATLASAGYGGVWNMAYRNNMNGIILDGNDIEKDNATLIAMTSASVEVGIEALQWSGLGALSKKVASKLTIGTSDKLLNTATKLGEKANIRLGAGRAGKLTVGAKDYAISVLSNTFEEQLQNATPVFLKQVVNALHSDYPDMDTSAIEAFFDPESMVMSGSISAIMGISYAIAGYQKATEYNRDVTNFISQQINTGVFAEIGFSEDSIEAMATANTEAQLLESFRAGYETRDRNVELLSNENKKALLKADMITSTLFKQGNQDLVTELVADGLESNAFAFDTADIMESLLATGFQGSAKAYDSLYNAINDLRQTDPDIANNLLESIANNEMVSSLYNPVNDTYYFFGDMMAFANQNNTMTLQEIVNEAMQHETSHQIKEHNREAYAEQLESIAESYTDKDLARYKDMFDLTDPEQRAMAVEEEIARVAENIKFNQDGTFNFNSIRGQKTAFGELVSKVGSMFSSKYDVRKTDYEIAQALAPLMLSQQQVNKEIKQFKKQAENTAKQKQESRDKKRKLKHKSVLSDKMKAYRMVMNYKILMANGNNAVAFDARNQLVQDLGSNADVDSALINGLKTNKVFQETIKAINSQDANFGIRTSVENTFVHEMMTKRMNTAMKDKTLTAEEKFNFVLTGQIQPSTETINTAKENEKRLKSAKAIVINKTESTDVYTRDSAVKIARDNGWIKDVKQERQKTPNDQRPTLSENFLKVFGLQDDWKAQQKKANGKNFTPDIRLTDAYPKAEKYISEVNSYMKNDYSNLGEIVQTGMKIAQFFSYDNGRAIESKALGELLYQIAWADTIQVRQKDGSEIRNKFSRHSSLIKNVANKIKDLSNNNVDSVVNNFIRGLKLRAGEFEYRQKETSIQKINRILNTKEFRRVPKNFNAENIDGEKIKPTDSALYYYFVRQAINLQPISVDSRLSELQDKLDKGGDFLYNRRDFASYCEFIALRDYGAMKYRTAEEVKTLTEKLEENLIERRDSIANLIEERNTKIKEDIDTLVGIVEQEVGGKGTIKSAIRDYFTERTLGFRHMLQGLQFKANTKQKSFLKDFEMKIASGTYKTNELTRSLTQDMIRELESNLGKDIYQIVKEYGKKDEIYAKFSTQNNPKLSRGQVLQIYATLRQSDYAYLNDGDIKIDENGNGYVDYTRAKRRGQREEIEAILTDEDRLVLDAMVNLNKNLLYYINEVAPSVVGYSILSADEVYCPTSFQHEQAGKLDSTTPAFNVVPSFFKVRSTHDADINEDADLLNLNLVQIRNVSNFVSFGEVAQTSLKVWGSKQVKEAMSLKYGDKTGQLLRDRLVDIFNGGYRGMATSSKDITWLSNIYRASKLLYNIPVALKQITSITAGALEYSLTDTAKYLVSAFSADGKQAIVELLKSKQATYRLGTQVTDDVMHIISNPELASKGMRAFLKYGSLANKYVDMVAIMPVAQGFYRSRVDDYLAQGLEVDIAKNKAMDETWADIEMFQQSSQIKDASTTQLRGGGIGKALGMFTNTQRQYLAYDVMAIREVLNNPNDTEAYMRMARTIGMNHAILPAMFVAVDLYIKSVLSPDDEEFDYEQAYKQLAVAMITGPLAGLYIMGAMTMALVNMMAYGRINGAVFAIEGSVNDAYKFLKVIQSASEGDVEQTKENTIKVLKTLPLLRDALKVANKIQE